MVKRSIALFAGLVFLLSFVVTVMISSPQVAQPFEVQSSIVTMVGTIKPASTPTATATITPVIPVDPIRTSTLNDSVQIFYYSYYNPDLLAPFDIIDSVCADQEGGMCHTVNCWEYNVFEGKCESKMASGLDWHEYLGKAVACGFEYPLGTVFRVLGPEKVAGDYTCLDRCPACSGKKQLDFLSLTQQLPWHEKLWVQWFYY